MKIYVIFVVIYLYMVWVFFSGVWVGFIRYLVRVGIELYIEVGVYKLKFRIKVF